MSSMLTAHPTPDKYWSKPAWNTSYNAPISYEGRNRGGKASLYLEGPSTSSVKGAMTGAALSSSIASYQPSQLYEQKNNVYDVSKRSHARPQENSSQVSLPQHQSSDRQYPDPSMFTHQTSNTKQQESRPAQDRSYSHQPTAKAGADMIAAHLQIPESVNKSKGSLAEFAAEVTCLFWFESAATLQYAENMAVDTPVDRGLVLDAIPSIGFRKWVTTIISTTQVGKNVVLLALMFIYRLKKFNPSVSGKRGSEFRLLTIALMLGNKFLDDNTYTNKTWAEVSGISVNEIHIMEVEFLSNMRYALYASESEWVEWKTKLGRFGSFYDRASKIPYNSEESKVVSPVTPTSQTSPKKLPSPPSSHHKATAAYGNNNMGPQNFYPTLPNPISNIPSLPRSPLRHQRIPSNEISERKRSLDYGNDLPPAKRLYSIPQSMNNDQTGGVLTPVSYSSTGVASSSSSQRPVMNSSDSSESFNPNSVPRLPMPRIPSIASNLPNQLAPLTMSTGRAMSTVYPTTSSATPTSWSQPVTPMSAVPPNLYQNSIPTLGDISRSHSNYGSTHTSPTGYGTNTPNLPGLSPSYFLTNRSSPYRPVRHVNTLLIPPPSAALHNPIRNIPHDQIRYQPLGKAMTEQRIGPVPYHSQDGWHQNTILTPTPQRQQYQYQ